MQRVFSQTFGVVGAIIERNGRYLLVKENLKGSPDHLKWNHPAGWIEVGEDPQAAVEREVLEETGFSFKPTHLLGIYSLVRKDISQELLAVPHAIKIIFSGDESQHPVGELAGDVIETKWFLAEEIFNMSDQELRDQDIKQMVKDYSVGKKYPLEILSHFIATK